MKNCKVILSGQDSDIYTLGELVKTENGFMLFYELDGDACVTEYANGTFTQTRKGAFGMMVKFIENEQSECIITDCGLSGSLTVFTKKLLIKMQEDGVTVIINYELGGEERALTLTAEKN